MKIEPTTIHEAFLLTPEVYHDKRGLFKETYNERMFREAGLETTWREDAVSVSCHGTLRGLHYDPRMIKLVQCIYGHVYDVLVDIRPYSPTYGKWAAFWLDDLEHRQLYIPAGVAHGFLVGSEKAVFSYKMSVIYSKERQGVIRFDSPALGIDWPKTSIRILSDQDAEAPYWEPSEPIGVGDRKYTLPPYT